jgi:type IV secretory pathway VirJ component
VFFVLLISSSCKQKKADVVTSSEKIVVPVGQEGNKNRLVSERFGDLYVAKPAGQIKSALVVFSDISGWTPELAQKANILEQRGVFVIGVDVASYLKSLEHDEEECFYLAGEIERLVQSVEKGTETKGFIPAALTGVGIGAEIAKNVFNQHPPSFFGLLDDNEISPLPTGVILCEPDDDIDDIQEEYSRQIKIISSKTFTPEEVISRLEEIPVTSGISATRDLPSAVADLPLEILMPDQEDSKIPADSFVIFLSGDGGWASIDEELSKQLLKKNIPVIGLSSLQYFWKKQSPATGAKDLERIIQVYSRLLNRHKVALFGFSFGADVLPAFTTRLSEDTKKLVSKIVILSPSLQTDYEIHISEWVGISEIEGGVDILPEVRKLSIPVLCLYGEEEKLETLCAMQKDGVNQGNLYVKSFPGDHHFDGEYETVAKEFLEFLN